MNPKSNILAGIAIFIAVANAFLLDSITPTWKNTHYARSLDLSKGFVKETDLIEIKNTGSVPASEYFFSLNDGINSVEKLSIVSVAVDSKVIEPVKVLDNLFKLDVGTVDPGKTLELKVFYVYIGSLKAIPEKIAMGDTQSLLLKLNKFPYSPYTTEEYSLRFVGISKGQEMDIGIESSTSLNLNLYPRVEEKALVYGPTLDKIPPFTVSPMGLSYEHSRPLVQVENLERSIWVPASNTNKLPIEEYYELSNIGAKLNAGFSRVDWMKGKYESMRNHWALSHIEIVPNGQEFDDYYFTDKVGMVTTHDKIQNHLLLQPRFPIFGGWYYNFTLGWNNQIEKHIRSIDEDTYIMKIPLLNGLRDVTYNNVDVNIYLPENAEFLNVSSPVEYKEILYNNEMSYLDIDKGHEKITIRFENLFDDLHKVDLLVKYRYAKATYYWKIFKIASFILTGLLSYYALKRIDLSIDTKAK